MKQKSSDCRHDIENSGGSNTAHWNTDHFEVRFPNGTKARWLPFVWFYNGPNHWKIKLYASLVYCVYKRQPLNPGAYW